MRRYKINVFLLSSAQALYLITSIASITFSGLVGQMLADNKLLATLPVAMLTLGTASITVPASFLMRRIGRRGGFMVGAFSGALSGGLAFFAIVQGNFWLFCAAAFLQGSFQAFSQYYRFAAVESAPAAYTSRAVSYVLLGGVAAAFLGPKIGVLSKDLASPIPFAGTYLAVMAVSFLALLPLFFLKIPEIAVQAHEGQGRPMREIMRQPVFAAAVLNACTSYGVMVLVMTATPLAMVACAFPVAEAGSVIQWHVLAMFLPSFFTGNLIRRFGVLPVLFVGMALFTASAAAAIAGIDLANFTVALILLGVAWNFMYVGGTTLLTEAYHPSERTKVQALNEFLVFAVAAAGSFSSGGLLNWSGWNAVNYGAIPVLVLTAGVTLWYAWTSRRGREAAARIKT
ncbi:MFS transporter [Varunaivibrio sulfuroxidans]|uniref:Putative MFS family arabinose efflux permease n=1 Tax=Varunaivibrio sulfuroxidans TaxID=1773489 RepID=A0A4R3JHP2_9PROT|nr:MFS transporter [Varunaivibrio sulfuroxidans]TCS64320.1 putative MFS family arabinose efflux permease [Varunaivibrio sulfuroxidans]WES31243.1 MFS transporter [Varunaivibrio sulfuroxidans]